MNRLLKTFGFLVAVLMVGTLMMGAAPSPPGGSAAATQTSFNQSSPFAYTQVCDKVRQWIPLAPYAISVTDTLADSAITVHNIGGGTPNVTNLNSSAVSGLLMDTDANDSVSVPWILPGDIDLAQPIYLRLLFAESSSTAGSAGFSTQYLVVTTGTTAIAAQSTTTGVTDGDEIATSTTGYAVQWTNATTIAASTFSGTPGQDLIIWELSNQFTTVTDSYWIGLRIDYSRRYLGCGVGM